MENKKGPLKSVPFPTVHFFGHHLGVLQRRSGGHLEQSPVSGLHPPAPAFSDAGPDNRDSSHFSLRIGHEPFTRFSCLAR